MWELAWPVSISTSTVTLLTLVNLFWVGQLGTVAVAAVSLGAHVLFIVFGVGYVVYAGALAIVARRAGEGDARAAFEATVHGVVLGALLGVGVAFAGVASASAIISFFDAGPDVEATAASYLRIMLAGHVFLYVSLAVGASYQAAGDTRTPMLVNLAVVLVNGALDPFFIFSPGGVLVAGIPLGWLGWGTDGAAVAAVISGAAGTVLFLFVSVLTDKPFPRPRGSPPVRARDLWHMARIGIPAGASLISRPLSTFLLLKVIAAFGTPAIAAFGIALRAFSVNWIPYSGLNVAISALVGQQLGARNVAEAERVVWRGLAVTMLLGIGFCVAYFSLARPIMLVFNDEPAVVAAGTPFLQAVALGFLFSAPMFPMMSAMNGAGDTTPPFIAAFLANWVVKLPVCWVLALPWGYGVRGVWIGMFVSMAFEPIVVCAWYRRGTWKSKKV